MESLIIYSIICISIIYFYVICRTIGCGRLHKKTVGRIILKIQSVRRPFIQILCDGARLRLFIKIIGIAVGVDPIALVHKHLELVVIGGARHTHVRSDSRWGKRKGVIVCIRRDIKIEQKRMGT